MSLSLVIKDKRFFPLFWTQFLGALNDNLFKNALVILITYKNIQISGIDSGLLVAASGGIFILPFFLFSGTAGQIAEKYEKQKVIKATKITELFVMILACIGLYHDLYPMLLFVLFLMGTQSAFFGPLKYGIIPELIEEDELLTANAYISMGTFISILLGTIIGGNIANYTLALCICLIGTSLIGIFLSSKISPTGTAKPSLKVDYTFIAPTIDIIKNLFVDKKITRVVLGLSWFWFLGAGVLTVLPTLCRDIFKGGEDVTTMFLATFTIGMGIGGLVTKIISRNRLEMGVVPLAALGMSLFLIDMCIIGLGWERVEYINLLSIRDFLRQPNAFRMIFDLFMMSIMGAVYSIPQITFIQAEGGEGKISQIIAGNNVLNSLFMVSASILIIVLYQFGFETPEVLGIFGGLNIIVALISYVFFSEYTVRFIAFLIINTFYNVTIKGEDNLPEEGPYIITCNHVSFIDWLFVLGASQRPVRFIIDHVYYYIPFGPFFFRQAKLIPIASQKDDADILEKAWGNIFSSLKEGAVLGIFPEGFISKNGKTRKFQPGLNRVVRDGQVAISPFVLDGPWGSFFSHSGKGLFKKWPRFRRKVTVTILPTINPKDYSLKDLENSYQEVLVK